MERQQAYLRAITVDDRHLMPLAYLRKTDSGHRHVMRLIFGAEWFSTFQQGVAAYRDYDSHGSGG